MSGAVTYAGEILDCRMTAFGRCFGTLCRLLGAPFPLPDGVALPVVVTITEDGAGGTQLWTRMYGRRHGFPQVVRSRMRFAGPTGLEERLPCGIGIALTVSADREALHFRSDHYFLAIGALRLRLPHWLGPGQLTISHTDRSGDAFAFELAMCHPLLGEIVRQNILFHERLARDAGEAAP